MEKEITFKEIGMADNIWKKMKFFVLGDDDDYDDDEYEEELMYSPAAHLLVRKQSIAQTTPMDNNKRYIISKSTTKTEIHPRTRSRR